MGRLDCRHQGHRRFGSRLVPVTYDYNFHKVRNSQVRGEHHIGPPSEPVDFGGDRRLGARLLPGLRHQEARLPGGVLKHLNWSVISGRLPDVASKEGVIKSAHPRLLTPPDSFWRCLWMLTFPPQTKPGRPDRLREGMDRWVLWRGLRSGRRLGRAVDEKRAVAAIDDQAVDVTFRSGWSVAARVLQRFRCFRHCGTARLRRLPSGCRCAGWRRCDRRRPQRRADHRQKPATPHGVGDRTQTRPLVNPLPQGFGRSLWCRDVDRRTDQRTTAVGATNRDEPRFANDFQIRTAHHRRHRRHRIAERIPDRATPKAAPNRLPCRREMLLKREDVLGKPADGLVGGFQLRSVLE